MPCSFYVVVTGYVRPDRLFVKAVNELGGLGLIASINEELRRIVVDVPLRKLSAVKDIAVRYFSGASAYVKASCRIKSKEKLLELLKTMGFRIVKHDERVMAYGVVSGRIVEVEVLKELARIKVGRRTIARIVSLPVPASMFQEGLESILNSVDEVKNVVERVLGGVGSG